MKNRKILARLLSLQAHFYRLSTQPDTYRGWVLGRVIRSARPR